MIVVVESPFSSSDLKEFTRNLAYARLLLRHLARRDVTAILSHTIWTQPGVLRDTIPFERESGIECGLRLARLAVTHPHLVQHVFALDLGWSPGMRRSFEKMQSWALERTGKSPSLKKLHLSPLELLELEDAERIAPDALFWWEHAGFGKGS